MTTINNIQAREIADVLDGLKDAMPYDDNRGAEFGEGAHISFRPIPVYTDHQDGGGESAILGWIIFDDLGPHFTQMDPNPPSKVTVSLDTVAPIPHTFDPRVGHVF